MYMYDFIVKKRQGGTFTPEELHQLVQEFTAGRIPDYQMSALLMAIFFRGMNHEETVALTLEMARSGDQVDLSRFGNQTADKHSTGGVGDKTTLIAAPMAAACGVVVAKMSGRGLGHTGGTVDKLESIPGFRVEMGQKDFFHAVEKVGLAVIGQSGNLAPADKKIYALRDVTATVENPSLIASSIMSKKLAAGSHNIILDVKYGSGAFMKTPEAARELAQMMVSIGKDAGRNVCAVLTNMNRPLGNCIGNALEIKEAVKTLRGKGPADLTEVSLMLSAKMIALSLEKTDAEAGKLAEDALQSGAAYEKLKEMVAAQGGDIRFLENPDLFPNAGRTVEIKASSSGYISSLDAGQIGRASVYLGAGRTRVGEAIDYSAGIVLHKKPGDSVRAGDTLAVLHTRKERTNEAETLAAASYQISDTPPAQEKLIYEVIQ